MLLLLSPLIAIFWGVPEWIVALFVDSETPQARTLMPLASSLILLVGVFVIADGLRIVNNQALNGLADMKAPTLITVLAYWGIAFPCGLLLGFVMDLGIQGFWIGLILGRAVAAIWYLLRFRRLVRAV